MKRFLSICLLAAATLPAFEEVNILKNVDFEGDYELLPGRIPCWSIDQAAATENPMVLLPGEGPGGKNAMRVNIDKGEVLRQPNAFLVAGERYRLGAYIRTSGLKTPKSYLCVWNTGWTKAINSSDIPNDTHGEWVKIEGEGVLGESPNGTYNFGLYAKTPVGTIDIACPYLIPLSEKALKGSRIDDPKELDLSRIIPVRPLLMKIDADDPQMTFYVPGLKNSELASCELGVRTKMAGQADFSAWKNVDIDQSRMVLTKLGNLPQTDGTLQVAVFKKDSREVVFENEYAIRVIKIPPKASLKRLNNMVGEILDTELKNGDVTFVNPREGWVFIGFDKPYRDTTATLDGATEPIVFYRDGEPSDTMRLLTLGEHTLHIENAPADGGRLLIRSVAQIMLYSLDIAPKLDYANFRYDMDFWKKHLLHSVNIFDTEVWLPTSGHQLAVDKEVTSRGMKILGSHGLFRKENINEIDKLVNTIRTNPTLLRNWGLTLDEISINDNATTMLATCEALWKLTDLDKRVYTWCYSRISEKTFNPRIQQNLLSACSNVSRGEGKIFLETYVGTKRTEAEMVKDLEGIPVHLDIARRMTSDAAERFMMLMSGYTTPECWCINNYPAADIKVVFDRFFNILATDPRMVGLYGMGCYSIWHTDEEIVRWVGKLMRHYCVEGKTESLAEKYGFKYIPGHLQDGDFEEGFKHWNVEAAEPEAIVHKTVPGYGGNKYQWRIGRENGLGDMVALFTKSANKPNRLSQTATGLTPGKLYCLTFMSMDYDDFLKPQNKHLDYVFNAEISDAEIIPNVTSTRHFPIRWYGTGDAAPGTPEKAIHRVVFRAKKDTATITFTEWKSSTEAGGPAGARRMINWIGLHPYYTEE